MKQDCVEIAGADANNLRDIDLRLPLRGITAITGVSGSGKSSLLAETIAAEGSRRTRVFVGLAQRELERDDVRAFIGRLPPSVLVGQRGFRPNVRTTVATATGLLPLLRRLFVQAALPYSSIAGASVPPPSAEAYCRWLLGHQRGTVEIWAAPLRMQKADGRDAVARLASQGIETFRVYSETDRAAYRETGREMRVRDFRPLNPAVAHTIEARLGSVELAAATAQDLLNLLNQAFSVAGDAVTVMLESASDPLLAGPFGPRLTSNRHWVHPGDPHVFLAASDHLLSFNAPDHEDSGACPACQGLGTVRKLDLAALVTRPDRSMMEGAFALWTEKNYKHLNIQHATIRGLEGMAEFSPETPWRSLSDAARDLVILGAGAALARDRDHKGRPQGAGHPFRGFAAILLEKAAGSGKAAEALAPFVTEGACDDCNGSRWSPQARALRLGDFGIADLLGRRMSELAVLLGSDSPLAAAVPAKAQAVLRSAARRADAVALVGMPYMTADRGMLAVSDGESRRLRLARVIDPAESGLCLLLDEPARGLHESDLGRLASAIAVLGNDHAVVLNEHRQRLWQIADRLIEIGPGSGAEGGRITYDGAPRHIAQDAAKPLRRVSPPGTDHGGWLRIRGATAHNVVAADCDIPLGKLTCICGVSGAGKSSFVHLVLIPALSRRQAVSAHGAVRWSSVEGLGAAGDLVVLDQTLPPPNRRSLVASLAGVFDHLRRTFAASEDARRAGLAAGDFGLNAGNGRCPVCTGLGEAVEDGVDTPCAACGGSGYRRAVLAVRVDGFNIRDILDRPIQELECVAATAGIPPALIAAMVELGIGHLSLGRRVRSLSGGELQRLQLALRLAAPRAETATIILDEPAVGLHPRDVAVLIGAFDRVVRDGRANLIVIEHDLSLISAADWVIEFGPGSGPDGGKIVFQGPSADLVRAPTPTGRALSGRLDPIAGRPRARAPGKPADLSPRERAARTVSLVRTLVTGDTLMGTGADEGRNDPAILLTDRLWAGRKPWEIGGLDLEIPKLLLDVANEHERERHRRFLAAWQAEPGAGLAINPFLGDMRVWGPRLPASVIRQTVRRMAEEDLTLIDLKQPFSERNPDVRNVRATGPRFAIAPGQDAASSAALRDARMLGSGYAELLTPQLRVIASTGPRLADLELGLVGPAKALPAHFSRHGTQGACLACRGARTLPEIAPGLIIGRPDVPPADDDFLDRRASAVLKGVRRTILNPFLARLTAEGLWDAEAPFSALNADEKNLILFGCWERPGPGSFLKTARSDPGEVASWLRWDGLHAAILSQTGRSTDPGWMRAVRESLAAQTCPVCHGSGLRPYARLLPAGGMGFAQWVGEPTAVQRDALRAMRPATPRARRTHERILTCLAAVTGKPGDAAAVARTVVEQFSTLAALAGEQEA